MKSSSRCCILSHSLVLSSEGKTPVVAPSSAIMLQIVVRPVTSMFATPGPQNSKIRPRPPLTPRRFKSSRITSFGVTQSERAPVSSTPTTLGAGVLKGWPAITRATSRPPAPIARGSRMGICPYERRAGSGEARNVQVVADAVPRAGVVDTGSGGEALQEAVVIRVLEVKLDDVVVNVLDREIHLDAVHAHPLELQAGHRARCVLKQCLIYAQTYFLAGI